MTFTAADLTAFAGGLAILVAAIGVAASKIITALTARMEARMEARIVPLVKSVDAVVKTVAIVDGKADTIKKSVDGTATESARNYAELLKEMASVRVQLSDEKQRTARLEQTQSAQVAVAASQAVKTVAQIVAAGVKEVNGHAPSEDLNKIETNTKATARNTQRTDDTVQELKDKQ